MNLNMSAPTATAPETPVSPPQKEITLKVAASEVKNIRIRSADSESKMIEISKPVFDTLLNTATFNIEIFNEIPEAQRPAILKDFTEALKMYKPSTPELQQELKNIDFKDKAKVQKIAEDFLKNGGGKAVLTTFKVMEWEASLLHGASGARFEGKDPKTANKPGETDIIFIDPQTGVLTTQKIDSRNWFKKNWDGLFSEKDVRGERRLKINTTLTTGAGSQIADANDIAYLDKCGWVNGTNVQTAENREILFKRLFSVAQARSELFSETGLNATEVSQRLNFVDNTGHLITAGRGAHLIGEASGGYTSAEFTAEAHVITDQIKTATVEKLTKAKKESAEARIGDQIDKRIADLNKTKEMTPKEIEAEQKVIEQEITKIEADAELFTRKKLLPGELAEVQKTKDEAKRLVDEKQTNITPITGETIDLLAWSDPSSQEYWGALEGRVKVLEAKRVAIKAGISDLQTEITNERNQRPPADALRPKKTKKTSGGVTVETEELPDPSVKSEYDESRTRVATLRTQLDLKRRSIDTDVVENGMNLNDLINDLESKESRRKQIVDGDANTKEMLENYRKAERLLKQKTDEQTEVNNKITPLLQTVGIPPATETEQQAETRLREEIKKKGKEKDNVGKASLDDQREISALSLIKDVIVDPEKKAAMEQRLIEQETGVYNSPDDILEVSPELKDYPEVVLHSIRLMFGPEALSSAGDTPLYKQTKALLESQWYTKIIIDSIEDQNSVATSGKVDFPGGNRARGGPNVEITMATLNTVVRAKPISLLTKANVNEAIIRKMIDEIRKSALGYI